MSRVGYYMLILDKIRAKARTHGYAIGLHGTAERDLDLIAVPWTHKACLPWALAKVIMDDVGGHLEGMGDDEKMDDYLRGGCPGLKPHGRLTWAIQLGGGAYIDLSVMPLHPPALAPEETPA